MIDRILEFSLRQRAVVLLGAAALLGIGLWSATHLPIDAVPDITGVQVQINAEVAALAAEETEKLITQPIERELAGLPAPKNPHPLEGKSLVPVLRRPSRETREAIFHVYPRNRQGDGAILGRAVRTERYRLVEWKKPGASPQTAEFELYDYTMDPYETKNLASTEPKLVKELQALITALPEAKPQIPKPPTDRAALFRRKDTSAKKPE